MADLNTTIVKNTDSGSYDALVDEEVIASLVYDVEGDHVALTHMYVLPAYRHHGLATEVIESALDDIRTSGRTVTVLCEAVRDYLMEHPERRDLVSADHPGYPITDERPMRGMT